MTNLYTKKQTIKKLEEIAKAAAVLEESITRLGSDDEIISQQSDALRGLLTALYPDTTTSDEQRVDFLVDLMHNDDGSICEDQCKLVEKFTNSLAILIGD